jgi:hypothetical protein
MPPKDKDPTSPKSPAKSRAKAKPKAETAATSVTPKKAAAPRSRKRVAAASADAPAIATNRSASTESPTIAQMPASTSEIMSDVSSSREAQIRLRAYLIYAERGQRPGSPESDWFQAEQEVVYGRQA